MVVCVICVFGHSLLWVWSVDYVTPLVRVCICWCVKGVYYVCFLSLCVLLLLVECLYTMVAECSGGRARFYC